MSRSPTSTIGFANGNNCTKDNKIWKRILFFILSFGRRYKMLCLQCGFNFYYHEHTYIVLFYLAIGFLGNSLPTCVNIYVQCTWQSDVKISLGWANKVQWNYALSPNMWKNSTIKRIMYPLTYLDPEDPAFAFHLLVSRGIPSQPVSNYIHGNGRVWRQNQSWLILKSKVLYHLLFPWLFLECYGTTWQICHFNVSISNYLSNLSVKVNS